MKTFKIIILIIVHIFHPQSYAAENECLQVIDVVYHGSNNNNIEIFEPKDISKRDPKEGKVIFASPSIRLASCYMFNWDDSWISQSISDDTNDYNIIMVISDKKRLQEIDKGGAIYLLPSSGFIYIKDKNLGIYEWHSKNSISPYAKIQFPSALEAMKKFGVKIYFVNKEEFQTYRRLPGEKQEKFLEKFISY